MPALTPNNPLHWIRVSRRRPCPVCSKTDWCSLSDDGFWLHCMRTDQAPANFRLVKQAGDGGYLFASLDLPSRRELAVTLADLWPVKEAAKEPELPLATLDSVYRDLLAHLILSDYHQHELTDPNGKRRLSMVEIEALNVKSLPADSRYVCALLARRYGRKALLKIPGFFVNRLGQLQLNARSGLLIPVSYDGIHIHALRIRVDDAPTNSPRYFYLSSTTRGGAKAVSLAAIFYPLDGIRHPEMVGITEGEFKAHIAAQHFGYPFISVPGVASWQSAKVIARAKSQAKRVAIYYDSEPNPQVLYQRNALADALAAEGLEVAIAEWSPRWKGIDDLLLAGERGTSYRYLPELKGLRVDRVINSQYLPDITLTKKVTAIKSYKGSGKTSLVARLVANKNRVLSIVHRIALGGEQARRFNLEFYQNYKNGGIDRLGLNKAARLTICADSLVHLDTAKIDGYKIVLLDEVEQILEHLTSSTIKKVRQSVMAKFKAILLKAEHIVILDADLSDRAYNFFARLFGTHQLELIVNTFTPPNAARVYRYESEHELTATLLRAVGKGKKCFIACGKNQAERLDKIIELTYPTTKRLCIHQDNSADPHSRTILSDLNRYVVDYDCLICSPSLGTGLDISIEHFEQTFVFGQHNTTTHRDMLQHAARNRRAKAWHCWIQSGERHEPTDPEYWKKQCLERYQANGILIDEDYLAQTGQRIAKDSEQEYLELWAEIRASKAASTNKLADNFYQQATQEGHAIIDINPARQVEETAEKEEIMPKEAVDAAKAIRHEVRQELKAAKNQAVLTAPKISASEAARLENQAYKTSNERAAEIRYQIESSYGLELDEELLAEYDHGRGLNRLDNFILFSGLNCPKERDKRSMANSEYMLPDCATRTLDTATRRAAFAAAKIDFSGKTFTASDLTDFITWVTEHHQELYRDLGIRVKSDINTKPVELISRLLDQLGLSLISRRLGRRGQRQRVYQVNQARMARMGELAEARMAVTSNQNHSLVLEE